METKVIESKKATDNKAANPVTQENKNPQFVAGNPVNKVSAKPEAEKAKDTPKVEAPKAIEAAKPEPANTEAPKVEPSKTEVKAEAKPVLNLEGTLKLVEELHRRKIQRDKLLETINNLEAFEFDLKEDLDETGGNIYQGCVLTIEDDERRKFGTKNPTIIWTVTQMVNRLCVDKLAEIEAGIVINA